MLKALLLSLGFVPLFLKNALWVEAFTPRRSLFAALIRSSWGARLPASCRQRLYIPSRRSADSGNLSQALPLSEIYYYNFGVVNLRAAAARKAAAPVIDSYRIFRKNPRAVMQ